MNKVTDQIGREVEILEGPARIISLVPSQTELLSDLGLEEEVIGITKFCVHPEKWFKEKIKVGGTKKLKLEKIRELNPDFIIANKEENTREQVDTLAKEFPVWVSDVKTLGDAYDMINQVGVIVGKSDSASSLLKSIKEEFEKLNPRPPFPRTAYLIWQKPLMTIGNDTFINSLLRNAGFENIFSSRQRYPVITMQDLKADCEILLLPSEPFPFSEKHRKTWSRYLPGTKVILVDGQYFSWYGSRLVKAPAYFSSIWSNLS